MPGIAEEAKRVTRRTARSALTRLPIRGKHRFARTAGRWLAPDQTETIRIGSIDFPIDHRLELQRYMYYGAYEEPTLRAMRAIVRRGDVCIDGGANIGFVSVEMARLVGPSGKVFAFEPSRTCLRILEGLVEGHSEVEIIDAALGAARGSATFYDTDRVLTAGYSILDPAVPPNDAESYDVVVESLDDLCASRDLNRIRYLKLDVEGSECAALQGAAGLLEAGAIDFVQTEISYGDSEGDTAGDRRLADLLRGAGFTPFVPDRRGRLRKPAAEISLSTLRTRDVVWSRR